MNGTSKWGARISTFVLVVACAAGITRPAAAVSLSLIYSGENAVTANGVVLAQHGDVLSFDIVADFRAHPTIGGGFDIVFDDAVLDYTDLFASGAYCKWRCEGDYVAGSGFIEGFGYGSFIPITGPVVFAEIFFEFTGDVGTQTTISLQATDSIAGPFISGLDFVTPLDVDFIGVQVRAVPAPGALLLLFSATATLGLRRRPNNTAAT